MAVEKEAAKAVLRGNGAAGRQRCAWGCGRRASVWWHQTERCTGKPDEVGRWTCRNAAHYVAVCRRCVGRRQLAALAEAEKLSKPVNKRKTFDPVTNTYRTATILDLKADEIRRIRGEYLSGDSVSDIARSHGLSYMMVWKVVNGVTRMDVK